MRPHWVWASLCLVACSSANSEDDATTGGAGGVSGSGGSVASGGTWPGTGAAPSGGSGGTAALVCDPHFSFEPAPPVQAGAAFVAKYTDTSPFANIDLKVTGPGSPQAAFKDVAQDGGNYTWRYDVSGHGSGVLSFEFRKDVSGGSPGTLLGSCQIASQGSGGSGGTSSGGGGTGSGGGGTGGSSTGNFAPACPATCPSAGLGAYPSSSTVGAPTTDHPPPQHGDLNIKNRGWEPCTKVDCGNNKIGFVYYPPDSVGVDAKAPRLHTLFDPAGQPFAANFRMYDWNWGCGQHGCKGGLSSMPWPVTAVTFKTTAGQPLKLPQSGYQIAPGGLQARALYVDGSSVTLKYTGEDNVVVGYTISIVGICPAPALAAKYTADDAAGRKQLPALKGGDVIGTACAGQTLVTVRDSGAFMDPRSETDWWQGHP
ncbi:MAG: hypothetical protein HYZ29_19910 [Myxococcales bacterium]|nr:hypothetical protein [Myxococcales bacterium]